MLSNTLNTNEVKDSTGTEVEFQSLSIDQRKRIFSRITELPNLPHRLSIAHQETGVGIKRRRRSMFRVDLTVQSTVDATTDVTTSAYVVLDAPVGALANNTPMKDALANLMSALATTGSGTTVLFDGTGTMAAALLSGGL